MENYFIEYPVGAFHFAFAIIALLSGTSVLSFKKGTSLHKKIGYVYALSMLLLNVSALMIYRLFDGFGIFHYAAILSLATVIGGMVPALLRRPINSWFYLHFSLMYWSVMGLYAAFASEILTRVPETPFFGMVGIASGIIMLAAGLYFYKAKQRWKKHLS